MPLSPGLQLDEALVFALVGEGYQHIGLWEHLQRLAGPLYHGYAVPCQILLQPQVHNLGDFIQAIDVDVVQRQPSLMNGDKDKGGASNVLIDAQSLGYALGQARLARAKLTG